MFCWKAILDRIPTKINLVQHRVGNIGNNIYCPYCNSVPESTSHLFMSCYFSHCIWMNMYNWLGSVAVLPFDLREHFNQHVGLAINRTSKKHWRLLWFSIIWSFWLHRNDIVFNGGRIGFDKVFDIIKINNWSWCSATGQGDSFTLVDWCLNPIWCLQYFLVVTKSAPQCLSLLVVSR